MGSAVAGNYIELKTNSGNENLLRQGRRVYMKAGMLGTRVGRLGHITRFVLVHYFLLLLLLSFFFLVDCRKFKLGANCAPCKPQPQQRCMAQDGHGFCVHGDCRAGQTPVYLCRIYIYIYIWGVYMQWPTCVQLVTTAPLWTTGLFTSYRTRGG